MRRGMLQSKFGLEYFSKLIANGNEKALAIDEQKLRDLFKEIKRKYYDDDSEKKTFDEEYFSIRQNIDNVFIEARWNIKEEDWFNYFTIVEYELSSYFRR